MCVVCEADSDAIVRAAFDRCDELLEELPYMSDRFVYARAFGAAAQVLLACAVVGDHGALLWPAP